MRVSSALRALSLLIVCQLAGQAAADTTLSDPRLADALDQVRRQGLDVIVAISRSDQDPQYFEFGRPDQDDLPPASTQVDVGSITKTITGLLAARLADKGTIEFTTTVGDVFPNAAQDKAPITLHQLLTHSAGLPDAVGADEETLSRAKFVARVMKTPLRSRPGRRYHYSNTGYGLAAAMLEIRSGRSYENLVRDEIARPAGLTATGYTGVINDARGLRSSQGEPLRRASWGRKQPWWNLIGNGGLISTPQDMLRLRRALMNGALLSAKTYAQVHHPHIAEDPRATSFYGYGVVVQESQSAGVVHWHNGGNGTYSAQWNAYPGSGDVLFVAGLREDAIKAMSLIESKLYR